MYNSGSYMTWGVRVSVQSTFREVEGSGAPVGAPQQPIFADASLILSCNNPEKKRNPKP